MGVFLHSQGGWITGKKEKGTLIKYSGYMYAHTGRGDARKKSRSFLFYLFTKTIHLSYFDNGDESFVSDLHLLNDLGITVRSRTVVLQNRTWKTGFKTGFKLALILL